MNLIKASYILRIIGFLGILPMFFKNQLMNIFPLLEIYPQFSSISFFIGISLFIIGAIIYTIGMRQKT